MAGSSISSSDGSVLPIADMRNLMKDLHKSSESFGKSITTAFARGVIEGRRFEDVLKSIGRTLAETALKSALKPVELALSQGFESIFGKIFSAWQPFPTAGAGGFAKGGVFAQGHVRAFAEGGVVAAPTYFGMAGGLGLMGERGAEAILPLSRGADGKLGVRAAGGGGRSLNVTVNIATPDADSFRRSEAQLSAAIARAVARGQRAL